MATVTQAVCVLCKNAAALLDEQDRCEHCVNQADQLACLLTEVEERIGVALDEFGVSADQLREWFELCLADRDGALPGLQIARRAVDTVERGVWEVSPGSAFEDEPDEPEPNNIRRLRRASSRVALEDLADRVGVTVEEVGRWERGGLPSHDQAHQMASLFGVSVEHLLGIDRGCGLNDGPDVCPRCGAEAPFVAERRAAAGWDVAGGRDLVCPDCLQPGDLDWPDFIEEDLT